MYTISYRQGSQLEKMELEDVYNDLRTFESEVEGKKQTFVYNQNAALVSPIGEINDAPSNEAFYGEKHKALQVLELLKILSFVLHLKLSMQVM